MELIVNDFLQEKLRYSYISYIYNNICLSLSCVAGGGRRSAGGGGGRQKAVSWAEQRLSPAVISRRSSSSFQHSSVISPGECPLHISICLPSERRGRQCSEESWVFVYRPVSGGLIVDLSERWLPKAMGCRVLSVCCVTMTTVLLPARLLYRFPLHPHPAVRVFPYDHEGRPEVSCIYTNYINNNFKIVTFNKFTQMLLYR